MEIRIKMDVQLSLTNNYYSSLQHHFFPKESHPNAPEVTFMPLHLLYNPNPRLLKFLLQKIPFYTLFILSYFLSIQVIHSPNFIAGIGSLVDLLLFYTLERVLFNRMVCSMGLSSQEVKKAIALWLMLEELGNHGLIRLINSYNNNTNEAFFYQALQCLACIQPNSIQSMESDETPLFSGLFDEPITLRFFYYNQEFVYKRYVHIMETVCEKIFGETKALEVFDSGPRPAIKVFEAVSGTHQLSQASRNSCLNPEAIEFNPGQTPEESRTMFLTFSMGYPLTHKEIYNFFTSNWGDVVQNVFIERTQPGQDPQFGRIVFSSSLVIPKILNGQVKAKFMVNRKHLWARNYISYSKGSS